MDYSTLGLPHFANTKTTRILLLKSAKKMQFALMRFFEECNSNFVESQCEDQEERKTRMQDRIAPGNLRQMKMLNELILNATHCATVNFKARFTTAYDQLV